MRVTEASVASIKVTCISQQGGFQSLITLDFRTEYRKPTTENAFNTTAGAND